MSPDYAAALSGLENAERSMKFTAAGCDITCNCKVKHYPNGMKRFAVYSADIIRVPGWEAQEGEGRKPHDPDELRPGGDIARSKRRAKTAITDLALSNEFKYFVTLTLDKSKVNRYDMKEITRKLNNWLDNNVRRKGLKYILVPERHRDGAIHFHGFFNDALPAMDSGTLDWQGKPRKPRSKAQRQEWLSKGAHIVYNLPNWSLGFSTAIELYGSYSSAVGYVCKYVSKADEKIGGRWYYSGGDLRRPEVTYHRANYKAVVDAYGDKAQPFDVAALGCHGIIFDVEGKQSGMDEHR